MSEKTLLVIDMQKDFVSPEGKLFLGHDTKGLIDNVCALVSKFKEEKHRIVATYDTHVHVDGHKCCEFEMFPEHCVMGTDGWDSISPVIEENSLVFRKGAYSNYLIIKQLIGMVFDTDKRKPEEIEIHVCGVCTHICVHDIIAEFFNNFKEIYNVNPKICLIRNCIDDFDKDMEAFAIMRMEKLYGVKVI